MEANPARKSSVPLTIRLFGLFEVEVEGRPLPPLRSRKVRWLLALLALRAGRSADRDYLASTLWPDSLEDKALYNLRRSLDDLRGALGEQRFRVRSEGRVLRLDLDDAFCDVVEFDRGVASEEGAALERVVGLYRGPLLTGCTEEWIGPERAVRERAYLDALEKLAAQAAGRGESAAAADYWRAVVRVDPLRESAQREWMRSLAASGDFAAAIQVYRELRMLLHRELNTSPDPATLAVFEQLRNLSQSQSQPLRADAPQFTKAAAALPTSYAVSAPGNLPRPLTRLIGRESEIADVVLRLAKSRLVTLTGAGGVGKTRLATEAGRALSEEYPDGAFFVDLAPLTEATQVPQAVASVLGVREEAGRNLLQTLCEALRTKRLLIVLDNCEHLLDSCAHLAVSLLDGSAGLRLLATSRQALGVTGEVIYRVPSLPTALVGAVSANDKELLPIVMEYEAVQLFVERAQAVRPEFEVTADNALAAARLCEQLDGIPLAIELAAARVRSLSVEQIEARLDDRFRLLAGGNRASLPRQQTLQALIDWSYTLLTEAEQALLCRLSVFVGGWTLSASEAVCGEGVGRWALGVRLASTLNPAAVAGEQAGYAFSQRPTPNAQHRDDVLDLLTSLVDKSLVQYEEHRGIGRYRLLESVRQYGLERLAASRAVVEIRRQHRDYFLALAEEANRFLGGAEQKLWVDRLESEHDNLLSALGWCRGQAGEVQVGLHLANLLQPLWLQRGYWNEGRRQYEVLLSQSEALERTQVRADALSGAGNLAIQQGDFAWARVALEESLTLRQELADWEGTASVFHLLGNIAMQQSDYAAAREHFNRALAIDRELGNQAGEARHLNDLGNLASREDRYDEARFCFEASIGLHRVLGNRNGEGAVLHNMGRVAVEQGEDGEGRACYEAALIIFRDLGNRNGESSSMNGLGTLAMGRNDYSTAQSCFEQALTLQRELGNRGLTSHILNNLGNVARCRGDYPRAISYYDEALRIDRELGRRAWEATGLCGLADSATGQGRYEEAHRLHAQALKIRRDLGQPRGIAESLRMLAFLAMGSGRYERTAILYGAATALYEGTGATMTLSIREDVEKATRAAQTALGEAATQTAWEAGRAMTLEQAIEYALEDEPV